MATVTEGRELPEKFVLIRMLAVSLALGSVFVNSGFGWTHIQEQVVTAGEVHRMIICRQFESLDWRTQLCARN